MGNSDQPAVFAKTHRLLLDQKYADNFPAKVNIIIIARLVSVGWIMISNFKETDLEHEVRQVPARTEIFTIPVTQTADRIDSHNQMKSGALTVAFEHWERHSGSRSIYQIRFLPLHWNDDTGEPNAFGSAKAFTPRRAGWYDCFHLLVDRNSNQVKFGPSGNIMIYDGDLRGLGVASYAFGQLIRWAQASYPHFAVHSVGVGVADAEDRVNRARRNHFYEKHGFRGVFTDESQSVGKFYVDTVADLIVSPVASGWETHDLPELLIKLLEQDFEKNREIVRAAAQLSSEWENKSFLYDRLARYRKISVGLGFAAFVFLILWLYSIRS